MRALLTAALAALIAAPCAAIGEGDDYDAQPGLQSPGGLVLFYESAGPMSFVAMTPKDVPENALKIREVRGVSCQRGLSVPTSLNVSATDVSAYYGNGSAGKAIAQIRKKHPEISGIYDVRTDIEDFRLLGIYSSLCTIVTARAFVLPEAVPASPKP